MGANEYQQALREARLPARHLAKREFNGDEWRATFEHVKGMIGNGVIIGLCGGRGTGKTQLAVEIARGMLGARTCRYAKAIEIFMSLRGSFRDGGNEEQAVASWCAPALLVIDEAHVRGETAFEDRMLTHVIDKRYDALRDTLLISNQTPDEFVKSLGPSIASRMNESGGLIECTWASYRSAG